jgi:hypothetical protein
MALAVSGSCPAVVHVLEATRKLLAGAALCSHLPLLQLLLWLHVPVGFAC